MFLMPEFCFTSFSTVVVSFQAPAAFGLVSFLLHEGFDRARIRKHLFIFAAAAPIGAIVTYMGLNQVSRLKTGLKAKVI